MRLGDDECEVITIVMVLCSRMLLLLAFGPRAGTTTMMITLKQATASIASATHTSDRARRARNELTRARFGFVGRQISGVHKKAKDPCTWQWASYLARPSHRGPGKDYEWNGPN
jgi:hypothetical protein